MTHAIYNTTYENILHTIHNTTPQTETPTIHIPTQENENTSYYLMLPLSKLEMSNDVATHSQCVLKKFHFNFCKAIPAQMDLPISIGNEFQDLTTL
jgi:hypothetical protein